jgi:hypothetical protein
MLGLHARAESVRRRIYGVVLDAEWAVLTSETAGQRARLAQR